MLKKLISLAVAAALAAPQPVRRGRSRTCDVAFPFRMGAGFPGDVNRVHPASIEPVLIDVDDPVTEYGQPGLIDTVTHGFRGFRAGDTAVTDIWGCAVRPYPTQQQTGGMTSDFGAATPPTSGQMDALRSGYIKVKLNAGTGAAKKGSAVFVWCAASAGDHVQGGIEDAANGGNTASLSVSKYQFNNSPDADGNVEICVNV